MKPEHKPVDYALAYGKLSGLIKVLSYYEQSPDMFIEQAKRVVEGGREVEAEIEAQRENNRKALETETP